MPFAPRRFRRAAVLVLVVLATAGTITAPASASTASSSPDQLLFDSNRHGNFEIYAARSDGGGLAQLTKDSHYDSWWPEVSPDGRHVVFYRTPAGTHDRDYTKTSLWAMDANGGNLRLLRAAGANGLEMQGHATWSPDGTQLVMFGGPKINPQILITNASGVIVRRLTARPGQNLDPSWSPDGKSIAFVGCPQAQCYESDYEIYTISASSGPSSPSGVRRVTSDALRDHDPVFRPGSTELAWLTQTSDTSWNIRANTGTTPARLTSDANGVNSRPAWSRDGKTIYFHRVDPASGHFRLYAMSSDGTNRHALPTGTTGDDEYPTT